MSKRCLQARVQSCLDQETYDIESEAASVVITDKFNQTVWSLGRNISGGDNFTLSLGRSNTFYLNDLERDLPQKLSLYRQLSSMIPRR